MLKNRIAAGDTKTVWTGFNISGTLSYAIRTRDETDTVEAWWILYGLGKIREIGSLSGDGSIEIPINVFRGIASARLRVRAGASDTLVYVSDSGLVQLSPFTFEW